MRILAITEPLYWSQAQLRCCDRDRMQRRFAPQYLPQWRHAVALHRREVIRLSSQLPRIAANDER
jgi:hypothetical protein